MKRSWIFFAAVSVTGCAYERLPRVQFGSKHGFEYAGFYLAEPSHPVTCVESHPSVFPVEEVMRGRAEYGVASGLEVLAAGVNGPLDDKSGLVCLLPIFERGTLTLLRGDESLNALSKRSKISIVARGTPEEAIYLRMLAAKRFPRANLSCETSEEGYENVILAKRDLFIGQSFSECRRALTSQANIRAEGDSELDVAFGRILFVRRDYYKEHRKQVENYRLAVWQGWQRACALPRSSSDRVKLQTRTRELVGSSYNQSEETATLESIKKERLLVRFQQSESKIGPGDQSAERSRADQQIWLAMYDLLEKYDLAGPQVRLDYEELQKAKRDLREARARRKPPSEIKSLLQELDLLLSKRKERRVAVLKQLLREP